MANSLFVYSWACDEREKTTIRCYGIDPDGLGVALVVVGFNPYVYVELPGLERGSAVVRELENELARLVVYTEVMTKKHLYSSHGASSFLFCQCESRTKIALIVRLLKSRTFRGYRLKVHEESATSILQMTSLRKIPMATWISYSGTEAFGDDKTTTADREYVVKWTKLAPSSRKDRVYPKTLAFDLEVNSDVVNSMPCDRPGDVIFQISCVVEEKGLKRKILLSLDGSDLDDEETLAGIEVRPYESEELLLVGFIALLRTERPNVLTGYNILMFDISYLVKRCVRYGLLYDLCRAGWNAQEEAEHRTLMWSSSALKNQEYRFIDWEGILILDLLPIVRRDYKLDNYKLDTVAQHLIGAEKDPVHYKEIFAAYRSKRMARVGKYCVQDSNLCIDLLNHINCWISLTEMAVVCKSAPFSLYTQGQQLKIYNQVYDYCLRENIVVTSDGYACGAGERYRGAYVMDPTPGCYENVAPLDVNSLYPSIIIAHNICYSTFVPDPSAHDPNDYETFEWEDHIGCDHDPKMVRAAALTSKIESIESEIRDWMAKRDAKNGASVSRDAYQKRINALRQQQKPLRTERVELKKGKPGEWEDEDGNTVSGVMCATRVYRFLKRSVRPGVIPTIIQNLLDSRRAVKAEMKTCAESDRVVLDKKQLAYKVSANSQYGAMGVRRGYLPFMPGAMCVTYLGREMIQRAGAIVREKFGGKHIYSDTDSVYVIFPHLTSPTDIWDHAIHVAEAVSSELPDEVNLEFEQALYVKFIILSKKRYMYYTCDRDGNCDRKIGKKGIVLARRDNSGFLKGLYSKTIELAFDEASNATIEEYIVDSINGLFRGTVPAQDFIITKSVGSTDGDDNGETKLGNYKVKPLPADENERRRLLNGRTERQYRIESCPAQVQLAERMRERGFPVDAGSRIEYVVLDRRDCDKLGQKIEDYDYWSRRRRRLKIDKIYYLKSLVTPLDQLLNVVLGTDKFIERQLAIRMAYKKTLDQLTRLFAPKIIRGPRVRTSEKAAVIERTVGVLPSQSVIGFTAGMSAAWKYALRQYLCSDRMTDLARFVAQERRTATVYPPEEDTFAWTATAPNDVRVVIIGQDPYFNPGQAMGLCFSVNANVAVPPSLANVYKELADDGFERDRPNGDLTSWANQGVLLLNSVLTVRRGEPNSHKNRGWETFTNAVIDWINSNRKRVVFLLWGAYAKEKGAKINRKKHYVLTASHPSPYSADKFFGCKHFSRTNDELIRLGQRPIAW